MNRRIILAAALLPLLNGCERMQRKDQASRLSTSLQAYASSIRWGNLDTAAGFLRPRSGNVSAIDRPAGLKVTGYEIRVNSINAESDEASVTMQFTYYFQDSGRLATAEQTSLWYFEEDNRAWLIDADALPPFR